MDTQFDLIVIGAGPAGYVGAIRAAQLGMKVACVEFEPKLGGTCLRVGCIPSKALLEASHHYEQAQHGMAAFGVEVSGVRLNLGAMMKHKSQTVDALTGGIAFLFKKNKVTPVYGRGRMLGGGRVLVERADGNVELSAKHIMIATGSRVAPLPGVVLDGDRVGTSTEAIAYDTVPEHLVVIGAGVIGLELGSVWKRLGAKVTVVEYADRILGGMDLELAQAAQKVFTKQGIEFRLGARVKGARHLGGGVCEVEIEGSEPIRCDRVLLAVGRIPNTDGLGLDEIGVRRTARGAVEVDAHFKTSVDGVFAVGDVIAGAMLAHKAEEEGVACVEHIATGFGHIDYNSIPAVVYTHPEIASVGRSEEQLKQAGIEYRKGNFPFVANGRAKANGDTEGKVKVLADAKTDRVLGVHIIGPHAGDLIAEAAVAMAFGASAEDIARASHAHPSLAETIKQAALAAGSGATQM